MFLFTLLINCEGNCCKLIWWTVQNIGYLYKVLHDLSNNTTMKCFLCLVFTWNGLWGTSWYWNGLAFQYQLVQNEIIYTLLFLVDCIFYSMIRFFSLFCNSYLYKTEKASVGISQAYSRNNANPMVRKHSVCEILIYNFFKSSFTSLH